MSEQSFDHAADVRERLGSPKKIFRVTPQYGIPPANSPYYGDIPQEQAHLELFASKGFVIVRGGTFNEENPNEFGGGKTSEASQREVDTAIAQRVGIAMPELYQAADILGNGKALVAKIPDEQRGGSKFLLETDDQKAKFLAWAATMSLNNISELYGSGIDTDAKIREVLDHVTRGNFDYELFDQSMLNRWVFEDFIQTPGDYSTSLRVVSDGYGDIHYAQIARSDMPKDATINASLSHTQLPTDTVSLWGEDLAVFLEHPDSPFYIAPKPFVSNISAGGTPIILNSNPVNDSVNRKILLDLDIDPDKPELPRELQAPTREIGRLSRRNYPFVGSDFVKDTVTGEYSLLEINTGPAIRPEGIGLAPSTTEEECDLALMQKVLSKAS